MYATRRVMRNTVVQVAAELFSKGAALVLYGVLAREAGRAGFGEFIFIFSLAALLIVFAGPGTDDVLARDVARERGRLKPLFWASLTIKAALGAVAVLAAVTITLVGGDPPRLAVAIALLSSSMLVDALTKSLQATFVALEDMRPAAAAQLVQRCATAVVGIAALLAGGGTVALCAVFLGGSLLGLAYASRRLAQRIAFPRPELSPDACRRLFIAALPLGVSGIFTIVLFRVDTVILTLLDTKVAVGLYGSAYRVLDATLFLTFAFVTAMVPTLARAGLSTVPSLADTYSSALKAAVAMLFPIGTVFALYAEPIARLCFGSGFEGAATALRLLGGTAALFGVSQLSTATLIFQNRQAWVPWVTGSLMLFNVALNFILIPTWSLNGAAFATTATEVLRAVVTASLVRRLAGPIRATRVVLTPLLGCLAMVVVVFALGSSLLGLPVALAAYALTLLGLDRRLYPSDFRIVIQALARRRAATGRPEGAR